MRAVCPPATTLTLPALKHLFLSYPLNIRLRVQYFLQKMSSGELRTCGPFVLILVKRYYIMLCWALWWPSFVPIYCHKVMLLLLNNTARTVCSWRSLPLAKILLHPVVISCLYCNSVSLPSTVPPHSSLLHCRALLPTSFLSCSDCHAMFYLQPLNWLHPLALLRIDSLPSLSERSMDWYCLVFLPFYTQMSIPLCSFIPSNALSLWPSALESGSSATTDLLLVFLLCAQAANVLHLLHLQDGEVGLWVVVLTIGLSFSMKPCLALGLFSFAPGFLALLAFGPEGWSLWSSSSCYVMSCPVFAAQWGPFSAGPGVCKD